MRIKCPKCQKWSRVEDKIACQYCGWKVAKGKCVICGATN